jgi:hypothetical protein
MADDDTMDVLIGFAILLALALFAPRGFTPSRNEGLLGRRLSPHSRLRLPLWHPRVSNWPFTAS